MPKSQLSSKQIASLSARIDDVRRRKQLGSDGERHLFYEFKPRPQLEYQHLLFKCKAKTIALIGANQIGKTLSGKRYVVAAMLGYEPLHPGQEMKPPPIKVWACTKGHLMEGLFEEILEMIPPKEIRRIRRSKGALRVDLKNRSMLEMKSYDMSREAVQQAKCDIVWWDEEGPEDHWMELQFRLVAKGGTMLLTLTPVKGTTWLHEKLRKLDLQYKNRLDGDFSWFTAALTDNDTVDPESLRILLEEVEGDEQAYKIRVKGQYLNLSGSDIFDQTVIQYQRDSFLKEPIAHVSFDSLGSMFYDSTEADSPWRVWEEPIPGVGYAIGADIAEGGERGDFSSAHIVKVMNNQVVAVWHGRVDPDTFGWDCLFAGRWYNNAVIAPEINRQGGAFLASLREGNYPNIYQREGFSGRRNHMLGSLGWVTTQHSKPKAIHELKSLLCRHEISIPDGGTLEELSNFKRLVKARRGRQEYGYGAGSGHDDKVMSLAIAIQATRQGFVGMNPRTGEVITNETPEARWKNQLEEAAESPRKAASYAHY